MWVSWGSAPLSLLSKTQPCWKRNERHGELLAGPKRMFGNDTCHFCLHFFSQSKSHGHSRVYRAGMYHPSTETGPINHRTKPKVIGVGGGHTVFSQARSSESSAMMATKKSNHNVLTGLVLFPT